MKHEFYLGSKKGKVELEVVDKTSKQQSSGRMAYTLIGANGDKLVKATVSEEKWDSFNIENHSKEQGVNKISANETMINSIEELKAENEKQKIQIQSFIESLRLMEAENDQLKEIIDELEDKDVSSNNKLNIPQKSVFKKIEDGFYGYQIGNRGVLFRSSEGLCFVQQAKFQKTEKISIR